MHVLAEMSIAAMTFVTLAASSSAARAQSTDAGPPDVDEIVRAVESESDCRVTLLGEAERDELSGRWLVAYSAPCAGDPISTRPSASGSCPT